MLFYYVVFHIIYQTVFDSLNLVKLVGDHTANGTVLPFLHLNGYKISAPTIYGRKTHQELEELIRGFGYHPIEIDGDHPEVFQAALKEGKKYNFPFYILRTVKGGTGPTTVNGKKIAGNCWSHQVPLPDAKSDQRQLELLEHWLQSYRFYELYQPEKGWVL